MNLGGKNADLTHTIWTNHSTYGPYTILPHNLAIKCDFTGTLWTSLIVKYLVWENNLDWFQNLPSKITFDQPGLEKKHISIKDVEVLTNKQLETGVMSPWQDNLDHLAMKNVDLTTTISIYVSMKLIHFNFAYNHHGYICLFLSWGISQPLLWSNLWIMEMDSIRGSWGVEKKQNIQLSWTMTHMLGYGAVELQWSPLSSHCTPRRSSQDPQPQWPSMIVDVRKWAGDGIYLNAFFLWQSIVLHHRFIMFLYSTIDQLNLWIDCSSESLCSVPL